MGEGGPDSWIPSENNTSSREGLLSNLCFLVGTETGCLIIEGNVDNPDNSRFPSPDIWRFVGERGAES